MQQAYYEANEMVMQASQEADKLRREAQDESDQIRTGALAYSNEILSELEKVVSNTYEVVASKYDGFLNSLQSNLEIVRHNKQELMEQLYPSSSSPEILPQESYESEEDFDFDEDTFINNVE